VKKHKNLSFSTDYRVTSSVVTYFMDLFREDILEKVSRKIHYLNPPANLTSTRITFGPAITRKINEEA
jgi:hypothetical protein